MICFPLDNTPYEAKDMGIYLATRTRGVFSADGNLAVTPGENGLTVSVSPGLAWLKWSDYWGTAALQEQALTLTLDVADGVLSRIDAIVCRLDKVNNVAEIVVKKGAPSSTPLVVPPVRDSNYDELYLATVLVGAGAIRLQTGDITDQRLHETYCGLMRDGVTGIPTQALQAQLQALIEHLRQVINGVEHGSEVMLTTVYGGSRDGAVDDADKLGGKTAADYAQDISTAQSTAEAAQSTANTAVSNAATAQSTANTAVSNAATAQTAATNANNNANTKMPIAGGTFTGNVAAINTNRTGNCVRNIYVNGVNTNYILMVRK